MVRRARGGRGKEQSGWEGEGRVCLKKDHAASILEEINVGSAHMMDFPTRRRAGAQAWEGRIFAVLWAFALFFGLAINR